MAKKDKGESSIDLDEDPDSSILDVEGIVEDKEPVEFENDQNESLEEFTEEPLILPGTSNDSVKEKENLPPEKRRLVRLPLARVKHIMKMDPECEIVSRDTVFLVTKATELFLEYLGKESAKYTQMAKRKTVQKRDVDAAIDSVPHLCFLEGALE